MENVEVDAHAAWLLTPVESNHSVAESTTSIQFNSILRHFSLTFPAKRVVVIIDVKGTLCRRSQSQSLCVCVRACAS